MGFFSFLKSDAPKLPKGAHLLRISSVSKLSADAVKIAFDVPNELQKSFAYEPGQYLSLEIEWKGEKLRRSYSICSGPNETLAIGVKKIENGKVSSYLQSVKTGDELIVFEPTGQFTVNPQQQQLVAIVAGSGITPIMSMLLHRQSSAHWTLLYGNKSSKSTMFLDTLQQLDGLSLHHYWSQEQSELAHFGRITEEHLNEAIKGNLKLLQADAFFLCGPQALVEMAEKTLKFYGVSAAKINKELFHAAPTEAAEETPKFSGVSQVSVLLDGESAKFEMKGSDKSIMELAEKAGLDVPFSCRGGVCCSCRAKVMKGSAAMRMNYALTDAEVADGYILSCQAYATSDELIVSFDA
ncbi:MAG: hypothetical protein RLZZ301_1262 [Bacteroidota bacterium]|jgi:ring-1,2-phenylacetyl-CoA epoxidase subunit PaaE